MADLGLQGAFGNAGMAAAIRQRVADRLAEAAARQDLDIRAKQEQRAEQAAQDTAAYRQAQMQSLADERAAIADQRNAQALKLRTDAIPIGATLSPDDAATLPDYLKQHEDAVLPSTAISGGATLPALDSGAPSAPATPTPIRGQLRQVPQAGHGARDVYAGRADQREAQAQQDAIAALENDPNTPAPLKLFLRGRMMGVNLPAGVLTPDRPKLTPIRTTKNGQPVTTFIDPSALDAGTSFPLPQTETSYGSVLGRLLGDADPKAIADGIASGTLPPDANSLNRYVAPAVVSDLQKRGFDLSKATSDWKATQQYLRTLNGAGQVRLRQAVEFANESLPKLQELSDAWSRGNFPPLNKAQLVAAKNGLLGPEAQQIATNLDNQITELQSELAVVYRGGNAPTDTAFRSAAHVLSSDWSAPQLASAIKLVQQNIGYRLNSIKQAGIVASPDNPYSATVGQTSGAAGGETNAGATPDLVYDPASGTFKKPGGGQ